MRSSLYCLLLVGAALLIHPAGGGQANSARSTITIHVNKSGLFSAFAHNHVVVAPITQSTLDPRHMTAEITVHSKELKVSDPGESASNRAEIQSTMLGPKVLDVAKYPEIHFTSSRIEQTAPEHFRVMGSLDLHGAKQQLVFEVAWVSDHYHGSTKLKQTDFGIQPVSIGGGTVKVKDVVEIEFDVYGEQPATGNHR